MKKLWKKVLSTLLLTTISVGNLNTIAFAKNISIAEESGFNNKLLCDFGSLEVEELTKSDIVDIVNSTNQNILITKMMLLIWRMIMDLRCMLYSATVIA